MMKGNNFSSPVPIIKLEKFTAMKFNDWKLNTQFGMKYLNMFYTIQSDRVDVIGTDDVTQWISDEDFCQDYLLNCLSSRLTKTNIKMKLARRSEMHCSIILSKKRTSPKLTWWIDSILLCSTRRKRFFLRRKHDEKKPKDTWEIIQDLTCKVHSGALEEVLPRERHEFMKLILSLP